MKKLFILLLAVAGMTVSAQKKQKIKGSREVLIKTFSLPHFTEIEIGERFEIGLSKTTDTTRVEIETDDNLFDVIKFSVEEGVLRFATTMEIIKKKRMKINVYIPDDFNKIRLIERGKVFTDEQLSLKSLRIEAVKKSEAELNLNIKDYLEVEASGKAELKLEGQVPEFYVHLTENASLEAQMETKKTEVSLDDHADCKLEGSSEKMIVKIQTKAHLKAAGFKTQNIILNNKDRASAEINVSGELELNLSGESQTYIYGKPQINLKLFKDNAAVFKK